MWGDSTECDLELLRAVVRKLRAADDDGEVEQLKRRLDAIVVRIVAREVTTHEDIVALATVIEFQMEGGWLDANGQRAALKLARSATKYLIAQPFQ